MSPVGVSLSWKDEPSVTTHLIGEGRIVADSLVPGVHIVPEEGNQSEVATIVVITTITSKIFIISISTDLII